MTYPADSWGNLAPIAPGSLHDLQRLINVGPGTPWQQPRPAVLRTKRCEHGLRCDSEEWLCEFCPPVTLAERKAYKSQAYVALHKSRGKVKKRIAMGRDVLAALRARECAHLAHVTDGVSAIRGKKVPACSVALCLGRLQREGKVEGFRIVEVF
jgi:hypothetical protein